MFGKKKQKPQKELGNSFDQLLYYNFDQKRSVDEQFMELADEILDNRPLVANFEAIKDVSEVNRIISFLSGVVYAIDGEVYRLGRETFMFASKKSYEDGTLHHYIKDFGVEKP